MQPKEPGLIDRLFLPTLTFCVLTAGTLAIGSFGPDHHAAPEEAASMPTRILQLEPVVISARCLAAATDVAGTETVAPASQRISQRIE